MDEGRPTDPASEPAFAPAEPFGPPEAFAPPEPTEPPLATEPVDPVDVEPIEPRRPGRANDRPRHRPDPRVHLVRRRRWPDPHRGTRDTAAAGAPPRGHRRRRPPPHDGREGRRGRRLSRRRRRVRLPDLVAGRDPDRGHGRRQGLDGDLRVRRRGSLEEARGRLRQRRRAAVLRLLVAGRPPDRVPRPGTGPDRARGRAGRRLGEGEGRPRGRAALLGLARQRARRGPHRVERRGFVPRRGRARRDVGRAGAAERRALPLAGGQPRRRVPGVRHDRQRLGRRRDRRGGRPIPTLDRAGIRVHRRLVRSGRRDARVRREDAAGRERPGLPAGPVAGDRPADRADADPARGRRHRVLLVARRQDDRGAHAEVDRQRGRRDRRRRSRVVCPSRRPARSAPTPRWPTSR